MSMDDNNDQMIFGDLGGLKLLDICLTGEEKPRKNLTRKLVPNGDRTRARCVTSAYATTCSTAVDSAAHSPTLHSLFVRHRLFTYVTYVTAHSPTLLNFSYVTGSSLMPPGEPPMVHNQNRMEMFKIVTLKIIKNCVYVN